MQPHQDCGKASGCQQIDRLQKKLPRQRYRQHQPRAQHRHRCPGQQQIKQRRRTAQQDKRLIELPPPAEAQQPAEQRQMQPGHRQQVRHPCGAERLLYGILKVTFIGQQHRRLHAVQPLRQPAPQHGATALPQTKKCKSRRLAGRKAAVAAEIFRLQVDAPAVAAQAVAVIRKTAQRKACLKPLSRAFPGE